MNCQKCIPIAMIIYLVYKLKKNVTNKYDKNMLFLNMYVCHQKYELDRFYYICGETKLTVEVHLKLSTPLPV